MIGMRNASVFPDPVQASTATSLFDKKSGMAAACTGDGRENPRVFLTKSRLSIDRFSLVQSRLDIRGFVYADSPNNFSVCAFMIIERTFLKHSLDVIPCIY